LLRISAQRPQYVDAHESASPPRSNRTLKIWFSVIDEK